MKFTFGIITGGNEENLNIVIDSIENENIPEYEIVIIGGNEFNRKNTIVIPFNENEKRMWITKKKNIITQIAKYENIVYMHDYIKLLPGWYENFLKFGNFDLCMNRIINTDGSRYRDWTLWAKDATDNGVTSPGYMLPYTETSLSKYMYFSGAYWVGKKNVMIEFPLDQNLIWGQGEDVKWSQQIRKKYNFSINSESSVQLLKYKDPVFVEINEDDLNKIKGVSNASYNNTKE